MNPVRVPVSALDFWAVNAVRLLEWLLQFDATGKFLTEVCAGPDDGIRSLYLTFNSCFVKSFDFISLSFSFRVV